jgi:integrase
LKSSRLTLQEIRRDLPTEAVTLHIAAARYMDSDWYRNLKPRTKTEYRRHIEMLTLSPYHNKHIDVVTRKLAATLYQAILKSYNVYDASKFVDVWRVIYNFSISEEFTERNPWDKMRVVVPKPRSVVWPQESVYLAIDKAVELGYNDLAMTIALMYDTAQRPGDIMKVEWSDYKEDNHGRYLAITQNKTGAVVYPSVSKYTSSLLNKIGDKSGTKIITSGIIRCRLQLAEVKHILGLDSSLQLRDLRRTAITEMSGSTDDQIMSVSGHTNRQQLSTYSVRQRDKAQETQNKRYSTTSPRLNSEFGHSTGTLPEN